MFAVDAKSIDDRDVVVIGCFAYSRIFNFKVLKSKGVPTREVSQFLQFHTNQPLIYLIVQKIEFPRNGTETSRKSGIDPLLPL